MNLQSVDITILICILSLVFFSALFARRYAMSVADFLSANRCAGRYLLTTADGMAGLGAVTIVAYWEKFYQGGFAAMHWDLMFSPLALILAMSGWVIYRYRQTRAMTLAQFLEMRYSRRFRVFAGSVCFISGVLNYGIFPAVTGRFLIYFLDLPIYTSTVAGIGLELNWTLAVVMAIMLGTALFITLNGGQIAVVVSDFIQGQLANICFLVLLIVILLMVPWSDMMEVLRTADSGQSKLNPFDQNELPDFSPMFFLMMAVLGVYQYRVWQGNQGYNAAAISPHEAKMANVLASFRGLIMLLMIPLASIAAWALLQGEIRPDTAVAAQATIDALVADGNEQLARQLTTTIVLKELLPVGVLGLLASVMIMAAISTDSTYLHSWGSIFIQDVLTPIREARGKPKLSTSDHLRVLKRSVFGVAVFAWTFSMVLPVQEYIIMYFIATGSIFAGGAGAVLIGGLYWRRGTTAAAWASMIVGSTLAVSGVLTINVLWPWLIPILRTRYPDSAWVMDLPDAFWLSGLESGFAASVIAVVTYVVVSLLSPRRVVDFDKLFKRGQYAVEPTEGEADYLPQTDRKQLPRWQRGLGITEEFTTGDKVIFGFKYALFFCVFGIGFIGLTLAYVLGGMRSDDAWITWWTIKVTVIGILGTLSTVWLLIGGLRDLFAMFARLKTLTRDESDDGAVVDIEGGGQYTPPADAAKETVEP